MPATSGRDSVGVLASMIGKTVFAISSEESRFTLERRSAGVEEGRPGDGGHRRTSPGDGREFRGASGITGCVSGLLPRKAMLELQKLAGDAEPTPWCSFSGDENHLFFELARGFSSAAS